MTHIPLAGRAAYPTYQLGTRACGHVFLCPPILLARLGGRRHSCLGGWFQGDNINLPGRRLDSAQVAENSYSCGIHK